MGKEDFSKQLTDGLLEGYAGEGGASKVDRASFTGKASHLETNSGTYHDEWFAGDHLGGGQELVRVGERVFTRLYGGGTPALEKLTELGITVDDVGRYLRNKITELGAKTRLFENYKSPVEDGWQYIYEVMGTDPNIEVVTAEESIFYHGTKVHWHPFILSPVK